MQIDTLGHVGRDGISIRFSLDKRHGVSEQSIYSWRKRFGEMGTDDVKNLKALEQENTRLKKLLAERNLEIEVMKEISRKKW